MNRIAVVFLVLLMAPFLYGQQPKKTDPCAAAETQAELNICWENRFKAADARLNDAYHDLTALLNEEQRSQLKAAQTAWLKYRDTNCEFVADEYKGGSMRPMIYAMCLEEVTRNRTSELKNQIKERNQ